MLPGITNIEDYNKLIENNEAILIYFSHDSCNVCKSLKPKVTDLLEVFFPKIKLYYVDVKLCPEIAAQNSVFTVPVVIVYFNGKEFLRKSRFMRINELKEEITKPYHILFK